MTMMLTYQKCFFQQRMIWKHVSNIIVFCYVKEKVHFNLPTFHLRLLNYISNMQFLGKMKGPLTIDSLSVKFMDVLLGEIVDF